MSNINNQEPQAYGLITLKTTFGDIDIELFTKQCPKATRNFVQHCLDGFYEGTIFDRVERDFIAVGGVPVIGIDNDYEPFNDEFHSRLRFTRRGLLATANTSKNDNGPKFFFTLGATPELQNKNTIFGRVKGQTVYTLVELNECQVDHNFRPESEQKILKVEVVDNPFTDIKPQRLLSIPYMKKENAAESYSDTSDEDSGDDNHNRNLKTRKKLKFGVTDESDEDESDISNEDRGVQFNRKLEKCPKAVEKIFKSESHSSLIEPSMTEPEEVQVKSHLDEKEEKLREIRAQIQRIKEQIENREETKTLSERRKDQSDISADSVASNSDSSFRSKKRKDRERETLELVKNFKKKLKQVATDGSIQERKEEKIDQVYSDDELSALDLVDGDEWLKHKFDASDTTVIAKDANLKDKGWYSIDDPRKYYDRRHEKYDRSRSDSSRESRRNNGRKS